MSAERRAVADGLRVVHTHGEQLSVYAGDTELARYVYQPDHPQLESPKPYFHPLRTLGGDLVSCYRPWDHIWHKGLQIALPHVADQNFWGGPTFVRDQGYTQLPNNGTQAHLRFDEVTHTEHAVQVAERLDWYTEQQQLWLTEERAWQVRLLPDADAWSLSIQTDLTNVRGATISFGSPTTNGRPAAGYGGLFWRGPRSFTGGHVFTPRLDGAEPTMGAQDHWLAYVGRQDGNLREATMVFIDHGSNPRHPTPWFVRSEPYAAVCPAPFFDEEIAIAEEATLSLSYDVVIANGAWDRDRVTPFVANLAATRASQ